MSYRKKLIEVSLPLEAINEESAREKSIRHGHPSTLHLWWARRPLAACRAVLWSSLVDDPSEYMPDEESANRERERLFTILEKLVKWENIHNEDVLDAAKLEIARSVARYLGCDVPVGKQAINEFLATKAPPVLDPFAGGGSIPLEVQRLGLRAYASDLNPVAVLINKALIAIPPRYAGMPPIHPPESGQRQDSLLKKEWKGIQGLAEDVYYYGQWIYSEAEKCIGDLYPKVKITPELLAERNDLQQQGYKPGEELTVITWLWARTVTCPNPACGAQMPLIRSYDLCNKKDKKVWVEPLIDRNVNPHRIKFVVNLGIGKPPMVPKIARGAKFKCLACGQISSDDHIKSEGMSGRISQQLMAIVAEGKKGRIYLPPTDLHEHIATDVEPPWRPEFPIAEDKRAIWCLLYGLDTFDKLFTNRQLVALSTISSLLDKAKKKVIEECGSSFTDEQAIEYANAVVTYLAFALDKLADLSNSLCVWEPVAQCPRNLFARQAIPMQWNFAEGNPLGESSGSWNVVVENLFRNMIASLVDNSNVSGIVENNDATKISQKGFMISTDPPYYDNIGYADLSDFFYIWLRKALRDIYPDLFNMVLVPKTEELIAAPYRFNGNKDKAKKFFENGLGIVFRNLREAQLPNYPTTIFYAFKQAEASDDLSEEEIGSNQSIRSSTGWETMLEGLIGEGMSIGGTWPMRTEMISALKSGFNNLASSIVLVCRPREQNSPSSSRREFITTLKKEIKPALHQLQQGNIAPVDLAQAAIGPGMAIFSRYKAVLEADGSPMRVRAALALINQALDEYLAEQEGEYDADTRWALAWFEQYGHEQGPYGVAETLSKAKNTSVEGLSHAGFLEARAGKVRLLKRDELDQDWDPTKDKRLTAWEATQYLIRTLDKGGEKGAGALLGKLGAIGETARDLAYRLYTICERKGWAQEALAYNMLVVAWPRIKEQSGKRTLEQQQLL